MNIPSKEVVHQMAEEAHAIEINKLEDAVVRALIGHGKPMASRPLIVPMQKSDLPLPSIIAYTVIMRLIKQGYNVEHIIDEVNGPSLEIT